MIRQRGRQLQSDWELSQDDILRLVHRMGPRLEGIRLVSIAANWGAPISGRFDVDFLNVWAVATREPNSLPTVTLYGRDDQLNQWRDIAEFEWVQDIETSGTSAAIYHVSIPPVSQFVLRMHAAGVFHYDNNGGYKVNYRIEPYAGLQLTHIKTATTIREYGSDSAKRLNWIVCLPGLFLITGSSAIASISLHPLAPFGPV